MTGLVKPETRPKLRNGARQNRDRIIKRQWNGKRNRGYALFVESENGGHGWLCGAWCARKGT